MRALLLLLLAVCLAGTAAAQVMDTPVKTLSGCTLFHQTSPAQATLKVEWDWSGYCVNGLTEGLGVLTSTYEQTEGKRSILSKMTVRYHQGMPFGFGSMTMESLKQKINYFYTDGIRHLSLGVAFKGTESLVSTDDAPLPEMDFSQTAPGKGIATDKQVVMYSETSCALHSKLPQFADCGFSPEKKNYQIYLLTIYQRTPDGMLGPDPQVVLCPDPRSAAGCEETVRRVVTPMAKEIMAAIEADRPSYQRKLAAMQATIAPQLQAERNRKQQAATALANEERARAEKLAQAGPGELFVLADEAKSRNDKAGARAALRALIKRFPDHALAKSAAAELLNNGD